MADWTMDGVFVSGAEDGFQEALVVVRRGRAAQRDRRLAEARTLFGEALSLLKRLPVTPFMANVLRWAGTVSRDLGDVGDADRLYRESLTVAEDTGSLAGQASALNCQAALAQRRGALASADSLYRRAARAAVRAGEIRLTGMIEQNLGVLANVRGNVAEAERRYAAARTAFEEVGDDEALAWVLNNLGMAQNDLEKFEEANRTFDLGLEIVRRLRDKYMEGIMLANRAEGLIGLQEWDDARESLDDALVIARRGEEPSRIAEALKLLGTLERDQGLHARAAELFAEALALAYVANDPLLVAEIFRERGDLRLRQSDRDGAVSDWRRALDGLQASGSREEAEQVRARLTALLGGRPGTQDGRP